MTAEHFTDYCQRMNGFDAPKTEIPPLQGKFQMIVVHAASDLPHINEPIRRIVDNVGNRIERIDVWETARNNADTPQFHPKQNNGPCMPDAVMNRIVLVGENIGMCMLAQFDNILSQNSGTGTRDIDIPIGAAYDSQLHQYARGEGFWEYYYACLAGLIGEYYKLARKREYQTAMYYGNECLVADSKSPSVSVRFHRSSDAFVDYAKQTTTVDSF